MMDNTEEIEKEKALQGFLLQKKLWELLSSAEYTRGDKIAKGAGLTGLGLGCAVFAFVIYLTGYIAVIQILLIPGAVICGLLGLVKLLDGLARTQEKFKCPNCATETVLLEHLTARPCPECLHVIHKVGDMNRARPFNAKCPHCLSPFHLYAGRGEFRCPNCGSNLALVPDNESLEVRFSSAIQCTCGAKLPDGAFACRNCCELLPDQQLPDIDDLALCSLSSWGHLIRARPLCERLRTDITAYGETKPTLDGLRAFITRIEEALVYLEVAAQERSPGEQIALALCTLQEVYTYVLAALHSVLSSKRIWKFDADNRIAMPSGAQHRVLNRLRVRPKGVQRWTHNLIAYKVEKKKSSTGEETWRYIITSYDKVLVEARRLSGDEKLGTATNGASLSRI